MVSEMSQGQNPSSPGAHSHSGARGAYGGAEDGMVGSTGEKEESASGRGNAALGRSKLRLC